MNALKDIAKGGWQPNGDRPIHRDTWKSDLKGIATGKKVDPYEAARNHQARPLASLKDPDSFGPPPKHRAYHGDGESSQSPATSSAPRTPSLPQRSGGTGAPAPVSQLARPQDDEPEEAPPKLPFRTNTTGLRTDHLPKPPSFNGPRNTPDEGPPTQPPRPRNTSDGRPPEQPPRPPRQVEPTPVLPPRQNEYPDEHTPAPPPTYGEATKQASQAATGFVNKAAVSRLSQAGVAVPDLGIGSTSSNVGNNALGGAPNHSSQLSELQQRFSRMNASAQSPAARPSVPSPNPLASAAAQKKPPPAPPKKPGLAAAANQANAAGSAAPPPIPMSSKPKFSG